MKKFKKFISIMLVTVMALAMSMTAFAAETYSITIKDSETVKVAGKTFNAYKILDAKTVTKDGKIGYAYTVPNELKGFFATRYGINQTVGDFSAQVAKEISKETDMFAFGAAVLKAAKDAGIQPSSKAAAEGAGSVEITGLASGYYVVEDATTAEGETVSALMLDTTTPHPEITIKADKPSIDKKIAVDEDRITTNNAAIGDVVNYEAKSKVPDMTGYKKYYFVVNDTMSKGLTFNNDIIVKMGNDTLEKDTAYTVEYNKNATTGETAIEIVFKNFIQYAERKGQDIVITYSATVNKDAVIGTTGNPNTISLQYSNNPNKTVDGEPENPDKPGEVIGKTPDSVTVTYVTGIQLTKVDPAGNKLTGAKFQITGEKQNIVLTNKEVYKKSETGTWFQLKDGTYTESVPTDATKDSYDSTTVKYEIVNEVVKDIVTEDIIAEGYVNGEGVLAFEGLSAGTYEITELIAPDGYNLLSEPIEVTITYTDPAEFKNNVNAQCTWTFNATLGENELLKDGTGNVAAFSVVNNTGVELPSTGGIGTTIFYIVGAILMIGAGVILVAKKRMSHE